MKILITGGNGQVADALKKVYAGEQIFALPHQQLDISDPRQVKETVTRLRPELIFNTAAYNNVDQAELESDRAFAVNAQGPGILATMSGEFNISLIHFSTDYVFDGKQQRPYNEKDATNPLSVYGKSKLSGEKAVSTACSRYYIRTAWVYHTVGKNFLKNMLILAENGPLKVVNDQFSSPTYALHLAEAVKKLVENQSYGLYHMAGVGTASRYDQLKLFLSEMGLNIQVAPISMRDFKQRAERPKYSALTTVMPSGIPLPSWEKGIKQFVQDYKKKTEKIISR